MTCMSAPKIMVFRPTLEEMQDFSGYITHMESKGAHLSGVAKVIPPKEFVPRKQYDDIGDLLIPAPIQQEVMGHQGLYTQYNIQKKPITVRDYKELALNSRFCTPPHFDYEDLERKYWKNITYNSPIYGADISGSIYDKDWKIWNINRLNTVLDLIEEEEGVKIEGVNTAYLYFGMWKTTFAWHTEDMDLYSINYIHFGAPKTWYAVPPEHAKRLERLASGFFPSSFQTCTNFLRHKMTVIAPYILRKYSIPFDKITQERGEFMITFPYGYHSGFNHGYNCAESTNFASTRWIDFGKRARSCTCSKDSVKIGMDPFVRVFQPDRYDKWMTGKDLIHIPEIDGPTPPTVTYKELPKVQIKEEPVEPYDGITHKPRRHPVHKKGLNTDVTKSPKHKSKKKMDKESKSSPSKFSDQRKIKTESSSESESENLFLSLKGCGPLRLTQENIEEMLSQSSLPSSVYKAMQEAKSEDFKLDVVAWPPLSPKSKSKPSKPKSEPLYLSKKTKHLRTQIGVVGFEHAYSTAVKEALKKEKEKMKALKKEGKHKEKRRKRDSSGKLVKRKKEAKVISTKAKASGGKGKEKKDKEKKKKSATLEKGGGDAKLKVEAKKSKKRKISEKSVGPAPVVPAPEPQKIQRPILVKDFSAQELVSMKNWARTMNGLWVIQPARFQIEQVFNLSMADQHPGCSVCSIFFHERLEQFQDWFGDGIEPSTSSEDVKLARKMTVLTPEICFTASSSNPNPESENTLMDKDGKSPILNCVSCKIAVHATCYGVTQLPEDSDWRCDRCAVEDSNAVCCLCNLRGGALKLTTLESWAHIVCAMAIPEVTFQNVMARSPIEVKNIPQARLKLKCYFCRSFIKCTPKFGACIQCSVGKCALSFHVTCAKAARVIMEPSDWPMSVYATCMKHPYTNREGLLKRNEMKQVVAGNKVVAKHKNSRFYSAEISAERQQMFCHVNFTDGSYSEDLFPEDIESHNVANNGPPKEGTKVQVKWTDGLIYSGFYVKDYHVPLFDVEFEDGSVVTVRREDIYAEGEPMPKKVKNRLSSASDMKHEDFLCSSVVEDKHRQVTSVYATTSSLGQEDKPGDKPGTSSSTD